MHYIQKSILDELRLVDYKAYTELNTHEVESSHFRYHLQQLIKDGYVENASRGIYSLTDSGISFVDRLSTGKHIPHISPKVITYTLLHDDSHVYLHKKNKEPYIDLLNMVGGKLHVAESSIESAQREVEEKLSISIDELKLVGIFEIIITKSEKLYTHSVAYAYSAELKFESPQNLVKISKSNLQSQENLAPDFLPIYNELQKTQTTSIKTLRLRV